MTQRRHSDTIAPQFFAPGSPPMRTACRLPLLLIWACLLTASGLIAAQDAAAPKTSADKPDSTAAKKKTKKSTATLDKQISPEELAKRESKSRPTQGIVSARTTGMNADGTVVITYDRSFLVPKEGYAVDD